MRWGSRTRERFLRYPTRSSHLLVPTRSNKQISFSISSSNKLRHSTTPGHRQRSQRGRGWVQLARGESKAAAASFEEAVLGFDRLGHRPDAARALLGQGRALLRAG